MDILFVIGLIIMIKELIKDARIKPLPKGTRFDTEAYMAEPNYKVRLEKLKKGGYFKDIYAEENKEDKQ